MFKVAWAQKTITCFKSTNHILCSGIHSSKNENNYSDEMHKYKGKHKKVYSIWYFLYTF